MDELEIDDIILGIKNDCMKEHRIQLIEILINKIAEINENTTAMNLLKEEQCVEIFIIICINLNTNNSVIIDLLLSLLVNITIVEQYASYFFQFLNHTILPNMNSINTLIETIKTEELKDTKTYSILFSIYIDKFLNYNPQAESVLDDWNTVDPWQNIGSILCNLCQIQDGRNLLTKQSNKYMDRLVTQDIHWWMVADVKVVQQLVLPLIVNTPFTENEKKGMNPIFWLQAENKDKTYESEMDIMIMLLECIILLCQRRGIREELRKLKIYLIIKNLDIKIEHEKASELIYEIVNFLMGDEDLETVIDKYENKNIN